MLKAFQPVVNQINAVLDIVGDGEERGGLESLTNYMGITNNVNLHGWQSHDKCIEMLKQSDVFIMPSLRESGGYSVLEAMASGLPVIVAEWGGPALTVSQECGFLVSISSKDNFIKGLANAMIELGKSSELRKSMGHKGVQKVKSACLDWESKCNRFVQIFEEAMANYLQQQMNQSH